MAIGHGKGPHFAANRRNGGDSVFYSLGTFPICSIVSTMHSAPRALELILPREWIRPVLFTTAVMFVVLSRAMNTGTAGATIAAGFTATTTMRGLFSEMDISSRPVIPNSIEDDRRAKAWLSRQKITGPSYLYVQSNVWQPGGSTGWHTHPGHSLIIVTAGTVTEYEAPDLDCKPHIYEKGMTFVDPHGDHAHVVRNEGDTVARTIAIQLIPAGKARRIDFADPGNCRF
jgi:quercetin dioxygenase-like cupin family protein